MTTATQADLQRTAPTPIYQQLQRYLRRQVDSGQWPSHYKLPAEVDLALELGVSRGTVRHALEELTAAGMLVRVHGRGTFVASAALEQPLAESLVAFSEELRQQGIAFETRRLSQEMIEPAPRVARLLGVAPGEPIFALRRVRLVGGVPVIFLENYVVARGCPGIEAVDFTQQPLFETLEDRFKLALDWGRRFFEAQTASPELAGTLEIAVGAPVMYLEQLVYLNDGTPIELSDVWLRGDRFRLSATVKRHRGGARRRSSLELY